MNFFNSFQPKTPIPKYVEFFFIQKLIDGTVSATLINTLSINEQDCLIMKTLSAEKEVIQIQTFQERYDLGSCIVIYGRNSVDTTVDTKYQQLVNLGFTNVFIYRGGMFEWALLQDIYGVADFPTTVRIIDPLKWSSSGGGGNSGGGHNKAGGWGKLLTYLP
jgi:hypothetical protein